MDCLIMKYDTEGRQEWISLYDDPQRYLFGIKVIQMSENGIWLSITELAEDRRFHPDFDTSLLHYSSHGKLEKQLRYSYTPNEYISSCLVDPEDHVYVHRRILQDNGEVGSEKISIVKYDILGNQIWSMNDSDLIKQSLEIFTCKLDDKGNLFVLCTRDSRIRDSVATLGILQYGPNGQQNWFANLKESYKDGYLDQIIRDKDGNTFVSGWLYDDDGSCETDMSADPNGYVFPPNIKPYSKTWLLIKLDSEGRLLWTSKQAIQPYLYPSLRTTLGITPSQEIIVQCIVESSESKYEILSIMVDPKGNLIGIDHVKDAEDWAVYNRKRMKGNRLFEYMSQ